MDKREKLLRVLAEESYWKLSPVSLSILADKILSALGQEDKTQYPCCFESAKNGEACPIHSKPKLPEKLRDDWETYGVVVKEMVDKFNALIDYLRVREEKNG